MKQVTAEFGVPIDADAEGKHTSKLSGDLLAALGDTGENGDHTKHRDEPKEAVLVAHFLQVKAGQIGTEKARPRQKEADAQTGGAEIDQVCPPKTDGLIFLSGVNGRGFRFRFYGDFVSHSNSLRLMVYGEQLSRPYEVPNGRRGGKRGRL